MPNIISKTLEPSEFSIEIKDQILLDFPEWDKYWKIEIKELTADINEAYIIFEIPTPIQANVDSDLLIYTMDEEITVCFDYYHSHFDDWNKKSEVDENTAKYFVKSLLTEKTGVISYWQNKLWQGSRQINDINDYQPGVKTIYNRIRIRSWNGTLNIDTEIA